MEIFVIILVSVWEKKRFVRNVFEEVKKITKMDIRE